MIHIGNIRSIRNAEGSGDHGVVAQVEFESKIEANLKAVNHMLVSSA